MGRTPQIAVIGAGLAGTACARALRAVGVATRLFDKGRGAGGRLAARRVETPLGEARFDHGAQYLTARTRAFEAALAEAGAAPWAGRFVRLTADGARTPLRDEARYVGAPGMNGVVKALQSGLDVAYGRRAVGLKGGPRQWRIAFEDGGIEGPFTALVVAIPAPQAAALLNNSQLGGHTLTATARAAVLAPCWAVMAVFEHAIDPGFDGAKIEAGALAWVARNASKPGRGDLETWVLHAGSDWSQDHLEETPDTIAADLLDAFQDFSAAPAPVWAQAHRWRYAMAAQRIGRIERASEDAQPLAMDAALGLGLCGDWLIGPRAEHAWTSGTALGAALADPFAG